MQLAAMAQQVVQVQVFLGKACSMQAAHRFQGFPEHRLLPVGQGRLALDPVLGVPEAFSGL
ncbi:hypothetical protein D3C76_1714770 [compost metagenome]